MCISKIFLHLLLMVIFFGCITNERLESGITEDWVHGKLPALKEIIPRKEAIQFVEHFFDTVDKEIFDESFKKIMRDDVRNKIISNIRLRNKISRKNVLELLNSSIKSINISHLMALTPKQTKYVINMSGGEKEKKPETVVSSQVVGDFGIIKVKSFLVPSITLEQVVQARKKTKNAKYLIYDLRDNGGGSGSSVSYLIETILGPDKTIKFSKTRNGFNQVNPIIKHGYFDDESNYGSQLEIEFENENGFVEWRTKESAPKDMRKTYVIINQKCASSCDVFAAAIKEHQAATLIGDKTAGHVLGATAFKLAWRGYIAIIPTAQVISPQGLLYEGIGIEPDKFIKSCNNDEEKCLTDVINFVKKSH